MPIVEVRGCDIAHEVLGSGAGTATPFVWGHGLTSSRWSEDELPLVDLHAVALDRPVVRYDARGHGESGSLSSAAEGDWAELALDQIAILDALDLDDVMLGGASMGAATALHAALALGKRVRKLVLVIPPTGWATRADQVGLYEQMASIVEARGPEPLVNGLTEMPPPDPFVGDEDWTTRRAATLRNTPPERLAAAFRGAAFADLPTPDAIATLTMPTLVLAWSGDPGHPVSTADRLGELLPNSEVVVASTRQALDTWTARCRSFLDDR